jgi:prepilin peptidase CpaA
VSFSALVGLAALAVALLACAITDIKARRIPNAVSLGFALVGVALHLIGWARGEFVLAGPAWWSALLGWSVGLLLLLPLHALRACAAGDVKLLAMVGAYVGPSAVVQAWLYSLAAGGVLALFYLSRRGVARRALQNLQQMAAARAAGVPAGISTSQTAARLPYGVAIAAGSLFATWKALPPLA